MLPFICCLQSRDQVHDPANWYMANPSLAYRPALLQETEDEYREWLEHPEQNGDFLTKRMGLRAGQKEVSVTDYEKVKATNRPLPRLDGWTCTVGLDYAELSDWAAVNLHFRRGAQRFDLNHAWICAQSRTLPRVKAPWKAWAEAGHCTVVEDVSIHPDLLAEYVRKAALRYNLKLLCMDHYRWTLVSESFRKIGFDANDKKRVKLVRPSDIMQAGDPGVLRPGTLHLGGQPLSPLGGEQHQAGEKLQKAGRGHRQLHLRQDRGQEPQDRPVDGPGGLHGGGERPGHRSGHRRPACRGHPTVRR